MMISKELSKRCCKVKQQLDQQLTRAAVERKAGDLKSSTAILHSAQKMAKPVVDDVKDVMIGYCRKLVNENDETNKQAEILPGYAASFFKNSK